MRPNMTNMAKNMWHILGLRICQNEKFVVSSQRLLHHLHCMYSIPVALTYSNCCKNESFHQGFRTSRAFWVENVSPPLDIETVFSLTSLNFCSRD